MADETTNPKNPMSILTISIAEFDTESRFRALTSKGSPKEGLAILEKPDSDFRQ